MCRAPAAVDAILPRGHWLLLPKARRVGRRQSFHRIRSRWLQANQWPHCTAIGLTVWTTVSDTQFHRFPKSSVVSLYNDILVLEPGAKFRITADFAAAYDAVADREGKCHDQKISDFNCGSGCHSRTSCYFTRRCSGACGQDRRVRCQGW